MTAPRDALAHLEACPFCGGDASLFEPTCKQSDPYNPADRAFPMVRCRQCFASRPGRDWDASGSSAVIAWNTRTTLRALLGAADGVEVTYELWQDGEWMAGSDTEYDIAHYAMMYGKDGPVTVYQVRTCRTRIEHLCTDTTLTKAPAND